MQGLNLALGPGHLGVLERHLLTESVDLPQLVALSVLQVRDLLVVDRAFALQFGASLDLGLDFKALLLKVFDLLNQQSVVLSQGEVLGGQLIAVGLEPVDFVLELQDLLAQPLLLVLSLYTLLDLAPVCFINLLQLRLEWPQLQQLSFLLQFDLLNLLNFFVLLGQLITQHLLLVVQHLEVFFGAQELVVVLS